MASSDEVIALPLRNTDYFEVYRIVGGKRVEKKVLTFAQLKTYFSGSFTQVQTDWFQNDNTEPDFLKNKPSGLPAIGGMYTEQMFLNTVGPVSVVWIRSLNKIYCANHAANTVTIFNATNGETLVSLVVNGATHLSYIESINEIWVYGSTAATTVNRINVNTDTLLSTFTVGGNTVAIGQSNQTLVLSSTKAYVTLHGSNLISIVNPTGPSQTGTISSIVTGPVGMAMNSNASSPMNGRVVVAGNNGLGIVIESSNTTVPGVINPSSLLDTCRYIKYVPSKDVYIVPSAGTQRIVILKPTSATSFSVQGQIRGVNACSDIFVDESKEVFYVSHVAPLATTTLTQLMVSCFDLNNYKCLFSYATGILGGTNSYRSKISVDTTEKAMIATLINNVGNGGFVKIKY